MLDQSKTYCLFSKILVNKLNKVTRQRNSSPIPAAKATQMEDHIISGIKLNTCTQLAIRFIKKYKAINIIQKIMVKILTLPSLGNLIKTRSVL